MAPLLDWYAPRYQAAVGGALKKHGLRYEDLYDPLLNQARFLWTASLLCQMIKLLSLDALLQSTR